MAAQDNPADRQGEGPVETSRAALGDIGEAALLAAIFPLMRGPFDDGVVIGPGDDTALVATPGGAVLATTDALVRGRDWRDEWSSGADVGAKAVAQNVADIAAMGGVPTALLVTLAADPQTRVSWVLDFATGLGAAARDAGVPVVGGDLSSAGADVVMVSVTALGSLEGRAPVCRGGAQVGDVVAVAGGLGRSGAGLLLLSEGRALERPDLVAVHRRPRPPYEQGPAAALAGARAMIDISDGLLRDAGRIATASGVRLDLDWGRLAPFAAAMSPALTSSAARAAVLGGGEEHSLLACFPVDAAVPPGWVSVGTVRDGVGVTVDGEVVEVLGWDHFGG